MGIEYTVETVLILAEYPEILIRLLRGDISLLSVLPLTHSEGKYLEILCL